MDSTMESDDETNAMTASDVLNKIEELWITEKMSPNLEYTHEELIDCMLDQLSQMNKNLERCRQDDFRLAIHKLEIDRIRFILSSYLRTRLKKIEQYVHHFLDLESKIDEDQPSILSPDEHKYAKEYASILESHLHSLGTQHMPEKLQSLDKAFSTVKPNLESYVFFKVKKAVRGLLIQDNTGEGKDEEVDLIENEQHAMRYDTVKHLLEKEFIKLM